ncbi:hypothetical protein LTR64_002058 [Lithohypha guttulata]|uniref:uncharacterized protein n=1 Tax=Lithohypha guttulata TaxID=1690604 RepID=UPI00315C7607
MAQTNDTVRLAGQAASLSSELYALQETCHHETTAGEISTIADELARLSTTLWHLNDAINVDPTQYTAAFNEDLKEITNELTCIFEEISECCAGLMAGSNVSAVSWFFKKGRVTRLLKHLEALKGTLVVMRTVLWHGKDYGTHKSDRLAESNPHTMHEDRVILESVLAHNRDAILDLHNLTNTISSPLKRPDLDRTPSKAGEHHRELSEATGVDVPPIPDVLPPSATEAKDEDSDTGHMSRVKRTFSKRGVRLGVHMSILDLSAHEAPLNLKKKWLQQAHLRQQLDHGQHPGRRGLTALPELSRISEVDTAAGSSSNLNINHFQAEPIVPTNAENSTFAGTPRPVSKVPYNTPVSGSLQEDGNALGARNPRSTVGTRFRRVMSRMSINNLRSPTHDRSRGGDSSEISVASETKGKEREHGPDCRSLDVSEDNTSPNDKLKRATLKIDKDNRLGQTFLGLLKQRFEKSPLSTPHFEKEFEYGKV